MCRYAGPTEGPEHPWILDPQGVLEPTPSRYRGMPVQHLLVQFGATALIHTKISAILPTNAFVPSVQTSEQ